MWRFEPPSTTEQQQEDIDALHLLSKVCNHRFDEAGISALGVTEATQVDSTHQIASASPRKHKRCRLYCIGGNRVTR